MNLLAPKEFLGLTEAECVRVQEELSPALEPWDRTPPGDIRSVAGVDLAYWQEGGRELAVCCIVVLDAWTGAVLEEAHSVYTGLFCVPGAAFGAGNGLPADGEARTLPL